MRPHPVDLDAMDEASFRTPVTLTGRFVQLVPLQRAHAAETWEVASNPDVTRYLRTGPIRTIADMERCIDDVLAGEANGTDRAFTTRLREGGRAIGMTRYLRIDRPNQGVEIGGTWIDPRFWRTPVNTEAKLLMLRHAFTVEKAHRVQLQTDLRNVRSQTAIARLGAQREGVLREDVVMPDGHPRSSVFFSILAPEWPAVEQRLTGFLKSDWKPPVR
jgi:N-acetyltransferase